MAPVPFEKWNALGNDYVIGSKRTSARPTETRSNIYIAQPPLFQIKRKKREEYVEGEIQLNKMLIKFGSDDVQLNQDGSLQITTGTVDLTADPLSGP